MGETSRIYTVINEARRRLRLQAALEVATTLSILATALAAVAIYLYRRELIGAEATVALLLGGLAIIAGGAIAGAMRRFPTHVVARRIDRECDLADRLGTATDFGPKLAAGARGETAETRELMQAAVEDAIRHLPRADAAKATPFVPPRDLRAAGAFAGIAAFVAVLYFPESPRWGLCTGEGPCIALLDAQGRSTEAPPHEPVIIDEEDLVYSHELLDELRETADRTGDDHLEKFVNDVDDLLQKAERGELSKEELLKELAKKEEKYMEGSNEDVEQSMADLEQTGKELKKHEITKELGKALEKGDLEKAKQEFEKLAQKLENDELGEKDREKLAKALEKAAEKFDKKEADRDQQLAKKLDDARKQVRRLQKKMEQEKDPEKKKEAQRRLQQKKRELQELEREEQKREESAQKRQLKRLHRNMREAAKNMRRESSQQQRRTASRRMKDVARDTGKVDGDRRKMNNQRKVASQLTDMKEALRRARKRGQGMRDKFGKNARNRDFGQRARGQQGSRDAWKPGDKPGNNWGTEDGGNPLGDPTKKTGNTKDESLTGMHGRGASTRETIITAAQKGFASRAYKQVYADYKNVIEEVMRAEKVPSGYKYYIKRYFQKIKPHAMD